MRNRVRCFGAIFYGLSSQAMCCLILCISLFINITPAFSKELEPAPYSLQIKWAMEKSDITITHKIYISPWIKKPGVYAYKEKMKVFDLVEQAGGLLNDELCKDIPSCYYPQTIYVLRPSLSDPDPTHSIYKCTLDWDKPDAGVGKCDFELKEDDFVGVSMSLSVL